MPIYVYTGISKGKAVITSGDGGAGNSTRETSEQVSYERSGGHHDIITKQHD